MSLLVDSDSLTDCAVGAILGVVLFVPPDRPVHGVNAESELGCDACDKRAAIAVWRVRLGVAVGFLCGLTYAPTVGADAHELVRGVDGVFVFLCREDDIHLETSLGLRICLSFFSHAALVAASMKPIRKKNSI